MVVGIVKEIMQGENRVAAIPDTVKKIVADKHKVLFEKGAGLGSFYSDDDYKSAGAELLDGAEEIYKMADIILKVKEPLFNEQFNKHEIDMMHKGQYLLTFIHPASPSNHEMVTAMAKKGVIGLTLDGIPRISRAQSMDALSSMSTCAGYKGILLGANAISKFMPMIGSAVGMIKPSNVFVIGAGVSGLRAIATAKSLGAVVYACDIRPEAVEQAKSLGARVVETGVPVEIAVSSDGKHAGKLSDEWLKVEREKIADAVVAADIVFCSALLFGKRAPILIDEEMVKKMKSGSTIVDISIDQGGNCSLTVPGKVETIHDVVIQGIKNIPGMIPTSSTWMFAHNIYNLFQYLCKSNKISLDESDEIVDGILVTKNGKIVHRGTLEAMGLA